MKTLHKFILKSYLGPFVLTFFIALFILLMQFLWKYIDDLVGKGLEWTIIAQLLFYASATLVPLALPLAILLSSIMTFGNLGEHYELVALKSSGLSLQRIMSPLIVTAFVISLTAFFFANNVLPFANLKMGSLLYDVRESKPAFSLKEGVFYTGIDGYSLRVGKKWKNGKSLSNILIYDHTAFVGNNKVVYADSGTMQMSADKQFLILSLYRGNSYEEILNTAENRITRPLLQNKFDEHVLFFDLSGFRMTRTDEDLFKSNYQMLNINQLEAGIDSVEKNSIKKKTGFYHQLNTVYYKKTNAYLSKKNDLLEKSTIPDTSLLQPFPRSQQLLILETAINSVRSTKSYIESSYNDQSIDEMVIVRHKIEWHKKITLSFACLVLFFIGAPLGAIIRKGGLGMPVVVSVVFFILFHVLSITGEKFVKEGVLAPFTGMWMASGVLLPLGIFLTYKATTDSALFDINLYLQPIANLLKKKKKSSL